MSEYQYYEFQAIERRLTEKEMEKVAAISSRVDLSPHRAVFVYNYGDFRGDPVKVLERYFDALVHVANWGSRWLYFRLPKNLISAEDLKPYCDDEMITVWTTQNHVVLGFSFQEIDTGDWVEGEGWLSTLVSLREQILEGDYRSLYLGWLKANHYEVVGEKDDERVEPPVPSGLSTLPKSLECFAEFLDIDGDLIQAAAEASPDAEDKAGVDWAKWISSLSRSEQENSLVRVARGDATVSVQLRSRVKELSRKTQSTEAGAKTASHRRVSDILVRAMVLREERLSRQKRAREVAHAKKMKALAVQEGDLWPKVTQLIDQKKTWAYEEAIGILKNLSSLAAYRKDSEGFCVRFHKLYEPYQKLSGLRWRLKEAGLLPEPNQQR